MSLKAMSRSAAVLATLGMTIFLISGAALAATVRCDGDGTCFGTKRDDRMVGTDRRDTMGALAGNDVALGRGGADRIDGGGGDDEVVGGPGHDSLSGEGPGFFTGDDVLRGGPGADSLQGGYGGDTVYGGNGDDTLSVDGGETKDFMYCGDGYDRYDVRSRGVGEASGNVYVAPDCEEEVDIPTTF